MGRATNMFCCWKSKAEVSDGSSINRSTARADKIDHHPSLQVTVDEDAQAEELRETRFFLHYCFGLAI